MKKQSPLPPAEVLCEFLEYHPESGRLTWRRTMNWKSLAGSDAGSVGRDGYIRLVLKQQPMLAHRVAWKMFHGICPQGMIDHIDGDKSNNRLSNLRVADEFQNRWNSNKQPKRTAKHNYTGIDRLRVGREKPWYARIWVNGTYNYLGSFRTPEEAARAYEQAAKQMHGKFFRGAGG